MDIELLEIFELLRLIAGQKRVLTTCRLTIVFEIAND